MIRIQDRDSVWVAGGLHDRDTGLSDSALEIMTRKLADGPPKTQLASLVAMSSCIGTA